MGLGKVLKLKRTIPIEHHSKEGLSLEGGKTGKTVYDDTWMHTDLDEQQEKYILDYVNKKTKSNSIEKSSPILLIKGVRTLNTGKLVKKRVPVRGKNGKIFYRMQWVDPNADFLEEKPKSSEVEPMKKPRKSIGEEPSNSESEEKLFVAEAPKKSYDLSTREGQVNKYIDGLSKDEKQKLLDKYDIQWDRHDHPMRDWMIAVMALKKYMNEHPNLIGLEHVPVGGDKVTPDGTTKTQDFLNNVPREKLYELCKQAGIADEDPRNVQAYVDKGTDAIRHLNNMGKLRKYLEDNPHLLDMLRTEETKTPGSTPTSSKPSTAQKGGNTINGILKSMSSEELYGLMKTHGIADEDPRLIPGLQSKKDGGNGTAPIKHMHNMMKLKALIEKDPSILNYADVDKTILSTDEQNRLSGMDEAQKQANAIKEFLASASKESKQKMLDDLAKSPEIANRKRYENPNKDWMESMIALRKVFESKPDLMKNYDKLLERDALKKVKITNHQMEKILRKIVGLKGEYVQVRQVEKGVEWNFGNDDNPSFARIDEDEGGNPILSVVDTGIDGEDWNQNDYPLKQIKEFLDSLGEGKKTVQAIDTPLHERSIIEIEKAVQHDISSLTDKVMDRLKPHIAAGWTASGQTTSIGELAKQMHKMGNKTVADVLRKMGVSVSSDDKTFNPYSNSWKEIAYGRYIDSTKEKNAVDYLKDPSTGKPILGKDGRPDTWVLVESAKHWTPEERESARKDLIANSIKIEGATFGDKTEHVNTRITHHVHNSTSFIPFDLFSDVFGKGLNITFKDKVNGQKFNGNHFNPTENAVCLNHHYLNYSLGLDGDSTFFFKPPVDIKTGIAHHSFVSTVSHEVSHAIDHMFSGYNGFGNWEGNELAEKYVGKEHVNCIKQSYTEAVERSNPDKALAKYESKVQPYYYHKDEWIDSYEGRIYSLNTNNLPRNNAGALVDSDFEYRSVGIEHWSMNVERYASAYQAYKEWRENEPDEVSLDQWASDSYDHIRSLGYGTDFEAQQLGIRKLSYSVKNDYPLAASGFGYTAMRKYNKTLGTAINHIFGRSDFVDMQNKNEKPSTLYNKADYTRKSVDLIIKLRR